MNLLGIFDSVVPPMGEADALSGAVESESEHAFVEGDKCGAQGVARQTTVTYVCLAGAHGLDDRIEIIHEVRTRTRARAHTHTHTHG